MKRMLCDSDIFIIHGHGQKDGFYISSSAYLSMDDINGLWLHDLKFALLLTCETGKDFSKTHITENSPVNIIEKMVCQGAETVIGFKEITFVSDCNKLAPAFVSATIQSEQTVSIAMANIDYSGYIKNMYAICAIAGNENAHLN